MWLCRFLEGFSDDKPGVCSQFEETMMSRICDSIYECPGELMNKFHMLHLLGVQYGLYFQEQTINSVQAV
jgi:hypothetical protein